MLMYSVQWAHTSHEPLVVLDGTSAVQTHRDEPQRHGAGEGPARLGAGIDTETPGQFEPAPTGP